MTDTKSLQRSHYGYWVPMPTRWMDNDVYGHVNNVTYYSFFDTAANRFLIEEGGLDVRNGSTIAYVVASQCEYVSSVAHPEKLEIGVRVNRLGNSSVEYGLAVFREGEQEASARGSFTHVFVSRASQRPEAIPPQIRAVLERLAGDAD